MPKGFTSFHRHAGRPGEGPGPESLARPAVSFALSGMESTGGAQSVFPMTSRPPATISTRSFPNLWAYRVTRAKRCSA